MGKGANPKIQGGGALLGLVSLLLGSGLQIGGYQNETVGIVLIAVGVVVALGFAAVWLVATQGPKLRRRVMQWINVGLGELIHEAMEKDKADEASEPDEETLETMRAEQREMAETLRKDLRTELAKSLKAVESTATDAARKAAAEQTSIAPVPGDAEQAQAERELRVAATKITGELDYIDGVINHDGDTYLKKHRLPNKEFEAHRDALAADAADAFRAVNSAYSAADAINRDADTKFPTKMTLNRQLVPRWSNTYAEASSALDELVHSRTPEGS